MTKVSMMGSITCQDGKGDEMEAVLIKIRAPGMARSIVGTKWDRTNPSRRTSNPSRRSDPGPDQSIFVDQNAGNIAPNCMR